VQNINQKNVDVIVPLVDDTLTHSGQSADAKATGDAIADVVSDVNAELATKQDTLSFATPTTEDVGKALMPKTVENGVVTAWEFGEAGLVDDVQINGASIV